MGKGWAYDAGFRNRRGCEEAEVKHKPLAKPASGLFY